MLLAPQAIAQQAGRVYRVAVFFSGGSATWGPHRDALHERLAQHGFVEGRNLQTTWRGGSSERHADRQVASELVATQPDAIVAFTSEMTLAAQWATKSIPIVFSHVSDPIADGVVKDYARPGGNTTGVSSLHRVLLGKRFELLRELLPKSKRVAYVRWASIDSSPARAAAARLGFELIDVPRIEAARVEAERAEAMVLYSDLGSRLTTENFVRLASKLRIPLIVPNADAVALGALLSYGTDPIEDTRLGAEQLVRVLKGAKPGALPVDQSSRFTIAVNLKTARALGITIPQTVLLRADKVIE